MRIRFLALALLTIPACQAVIGADDFRFDATPLAPNGSGGEGGEMAAGGTGGVGGVGGEAPIPECEVAADCPGVESTCAFRTCVGGTCAIEDAPAATACTEDEGRLCNGNGACVSCLEDEDCEDSNLACDDQMCVPGSCSDGMLNGDEVDTDCGGSCARCDDGASCGDAPDCKSGFCDGGTCTACGDDVDCEGLADHYCDGGTCLLRISQGDVCSADNECTTGHCVDGVCCESACDGECESCSAVKTGDDYGVCAPAPDGTDPDQECPPLQACNGARSCALI